MHTLLSAFPSQQFYDGQLEDAEGKTPESLAEKVMEGQIIGLSIWVSWKNDSLSLILED